MFQQITSRKRRVLGARHASTGVSKGSSWHEKGARTRVEEGGISVSSLHMFP